MSRSPRPPGTKKRSGSRPRKADAPARAAEPVVAFADAAGWHAWLASHHASSFGVALKIGK